MLNVKLTLQKRTYRAGFVFEDYYNNVGMYSVHNTMPTYQQGSLFIGQMYHYRLSTLCCFHIFFGKEAGRKDPERGISKSLLSASLLAILLLIQNKNPNRNNNKCMNLHKHIYTIKIVIILL